MIFFHYMSKNIFIIHYIFKFTTFKIIVPDFGFGAANSKIEVPAYSSSCYFFIIITKIFNISKKIT